MRNQRLICFPGVGILMIRKSQRTFVKFGIFQYSNAQFPPTVDGISFIKFTIWICQLLVNFLISNSLIYSMHWISNGLRLSELIGIWTHLEFRTRISPKQLTSFLSKPQLKVSTCFSILLLKVFISFRAAESWWIRVAKKCYYSGNAWILKPRFLLCFTCLVFLSKI